MELSLESVLCEGCGKMFSRNISATWRTYCSRTCPRLIEQTVQATCEGCLRPFSRQSKQTWRKYCSKACVPQVITETVICQGCQQSFSRKPDQSWRKYCSKECLPKTKQCVRCGKTFPKNNYQPFENCCSSTCRDLRLVTRTCLNCHQEFQVIASEGWKKLCGRANCFNLHNFSKGHPKETKGFSAKAIVWLEQIAQKEGINIQHAQNGKEYRIPHGTSFIYFDGYCQATNTVYEFYGDYWHGHPDKFDPEEINPETNCTFGELYERTLLREKFILAQGYHLVTIWESEFDAIA